MDNTKQVNGVVEKFSLEEIKKMLNGWEAFHSDHLKKFCCCVVTEDFLYSQHSIPLLREALKLKQESLNAE